MTRHEAIEKALQNMMGMFDTPTMRLQIKFSSWMEEACASGRDALALPEDSKVVNAELYEAMRDFGDTHARNMILRFCPPGDTNAHYEKHLTIIAKLIRYLELREASGDPMPYRVVRDGDKVRFE